MDHPIHPGEEGRLIFISNDGTCVEAKVFIYSIGKQEAPTQFDWTFKTLGPVKLTKDYPSDAALRILGPLD
jgi:hypothetical protein